MHPYNPAAVKYFGLNHRFKVFTGARYLGGFIGDEKSKRDWLKYQKLKWEENIRTITEMARKYLQDKRPTG